ncbi:MAG: hypothetical protein MJ245_04010 [Clostridia bacterium]|nr:hypothetical protein [Clostridia bacterium]
MDFRRLWLDDDFRKNVKTLGIVVAIVIVIAIIANLNFSSPIKDTVDDVGPKVVRVTSNNMDGTYTINQAIEIVLEFNEEFVLSLDGDPRLALQLDDGTVKYATYVNNGSNTEMTFKYVIKKGDKASHLEYTSEDALEARGITMKDRKGNVASLLLPLTNSDNSLGGNKNISIVTDDPYAIITETQKSKELKEYLIVFNRKVEGFTESDIKVFDGMLANFRAVEENRIYKVDCTRTTTVDPTIVIASNVCNDIENGIPNTYSIPVPRGFYYYGGYKENGIVISDNSKDKNSSFYERGNLEENCNVSNYGNNFVWCPIDYINDQTGSYYVKGTKELVDNQRFGRRDFNLYGYGTFEDYEETIPTNVVDSILKYQGFYVGRYEGILGSDGRMGCKRSNKNPTGYVGRIKNSDQKSVLALYNYVSASNAASAINKSYSSASSVVAHLPYGAEWDTVMMWFKESDIDVDSDSSNWGNYQNIEITGIKAGNQQDILNTGVSNYTQANHIYDLAGNLWEWTQESTTQGNVVRGGVYGSAGTQTPAAYRTAFGNAANTFLCTSRPFLYVK